MTTGPTQEELGRRFAALHEEGCFLIPNPWDGGTARVLGSLGFEAPATSSSAFAFTLGRADGAVGGSIEDWDAEAGIYEIGAAAERIAAATRMRDDGDLSGLRGGGRVAEWLGG